MSCLLLSLTLQSQVTEDWVSPELSYYKNGKMIAADASNHVFTLSDIWNGDMYLTKRDESGNILWTATYDNTAPSQWEVGSWITIDPFGDAIVTGYTNIGFGSEYYAYQMVTMKFNGEDGGLIWRKTYNTGSPHRGRRCLTDAEGNIYIGGDINATNTTYYELGNMVVKKYDTDGNELWSVSTNELGTVMMGPLHAMKFDHDGNIIISGASPLGYGVCLAKISPEGNAQWSTTFSSYGFSDVSVDPSNNILLLYTYSFGVPPINMNPAVKKYSPTGTELWSHDYNFGSAEIGRQIQCDATGGAFITGYGSQLTGMPYVDWITFRIDATGTMLWSQRYNEHANNDEWPRMMIKDNEDNIYITGTGGPYPGGATLSYQQLVTIKYNIDGVEQWTMLHNTYSASGNALCFGSDHSIFVVGQGSAVTIHYIETTPPVCDIPAGLFTNNITTTKAKLNWTVVPGAFQYEVWYKKAAAANWKKKFVPGINNKLNLKNLVCNTNYVWKIRTVCDTTGIDLVSDFSADQLFTTAACREEFVMEDNISIYPNPAIDQINIHAPGMEISECKMIDIEGRVVLVQPYPVQEQLSIDVSELPAGIYLISLQTSAGLINRQIIISK